MEKTNGHGHIWHCRYCGKWVCIMMSSSILGYIHTYMTCINLTDEIAVLTLPYSVSSFFPLSCLNCYEICRCLDIKWWRHQMVTFSASLAICAGNSPVPGEFSAQRSVTRSVDVFFDLRPNKRLSKQSRGWWFEPPSRPVRRWHVWCISEQIGKTMDPYLTA